MLVGNEVVSMQRPMHCAAASRTPPTSIAGARRATSSKNPLVTSESTSSAHSPSASSTGSAPASASAALTCESRTICSGVEA